MAAARLVDELRRRCRHTTSRCSATSRTSPTTGSCCPRCSRAPTIRANAGLRTPRRGRPAARHPRAREIDRERGEVELADRSRLSYDRLVLATGSIPTCRRSWPGAVADGSLHKRVHAFRTLDDCRRLDAAVPHARTAVVVGGGLLGLEAARALSIRGVATEVVEGGEHLMRSQVDPRAGAILAGT